MKNLKFRAWDKQLKRFEYFDLATCLPCFADESQFVIQQSSGLFDKNGIEIYEGDILADLNFTQFHYTCKYFSRFSKSGFEMDSCYGYSFGGESYLIKIIGNIFENENLLTGE